MKVKAVKWAEWAANPSRGSVCCRSCEKTIRGGDFFEADDMDAKGRRYLCTDCVGKSGAEQVLDFAAAPAGQAAKRPMVEMLPSHVAKISEMIATAIRTHEAEFHGAEAEGVELEKPDLPSPPKRPRGRPRKVKEEAGGAE